jgi:hypothetical protein
VRQALEERAPVSEDLALIPQRGDVVVVAPEVLGLSSPVTSNGKPLTVCGRACTLRMPRKSWRGTTQRSRRSLSRCRRPGLIRGPGPLSTSTRQPRDPKSQRTRWSVSPDKPKELSCFSARLLGRENRRLQHYFFEQGKVKLTCGAGKLADGGL